MTTIAARKRRRQQSVIFRQARMDLLAELDQLKDQACEKCRKPVSGDQYTCSCPAATRMREIGQELSTSINERTKIDVFTKEVMKVAMKNKTPEITEEAVNAMRDKGMTYAAIAKEFGVSAPALANRRQNWELERVRAQHHERKSVKKPLEQESVAGVVTAESSAVPSALEDEIEELKEVVISKDAIIRNQTQTIKLLKTKLSDCVSDLVKEYEPIEEDRYEAIKDDHKLLAILLERETMRIKKLVEVR